ncbi:MAG: hypothetical protein RH917_02340 [Lacipirellulaceae bacterium]
MIRIRSIACLALAALVITCVMSVDASACPTCKDGISENDPAAQSMAAGYFYSILFMMTMPFLILGSFISFAYWSIRRRTHSQLETS